MSSTSKKHQ
jgi:hypothetical protein